jgi:hypothetical protein
MVETGVPLILKIATTWPAAKRLPGLDILRLLAAAAPNVRIASIALLTLRGDSKTPLDITPDTTFSSLYSADAAAKRLPGLDILRLLAAAAPFTASAEYKDENVVLWRSLKSMALRFQPRVKLGAVGKIRADRTGRQPFPPPLSIRSANVKVITKKLQELNAQLVSDGSKDVALSPSAPVSTSGEAWSCWEDSS